MYTDAEAATEADVMTESAEADVTADAETKAADADAIKIRQVHLSVTEYQP